MDSEWFKQRKRELKVTDTALAEALGVERSVANKVVNGKVAMNARRADAVAALLEVKRDEVLFRAGLTAEQPQPAEHAGEAATTPAATLADLAAEHGLVLVDEIDLPLGMGATYLDHGTPEVLGIVPFRADWLRGLFEGPVERLKVVRGRGDSMEPTIRDGDVVLVDTAQRRINDQDRIWAVAYGDLGMIRRIRVTPRGSWMLMPDNQVVRPDEVGDGEVSVIGQVIWIGRRI